MIVWLSLLRNFSIKLKFTTNLSKRLHFIDHFYTIFIWIKPWIRCTLNDVVDFSNLWVHFKLLILKYCIFISDASLLDGFYLYTSSIFSVTVTPLPIDLIYFCQFVSSFLYVICDDMIYEYINFWMQKETCILLFYFIARYIWLKMRFRLFTCVFTSNKFRFNPS